MKSRTNHYHRQDKNNVTGYWAAHIDEKFRRFVSRLVNGCIPKRPPPPTTTTAATTTTPEAPTTEPASTLPPTTMTTLPPPPPPTEPADIFEDFTLDIDNIEDSLQVTKMPLGGVEVSNNMDRDAGKGPGFRRRILAVPPVEGCTDEYSADDVYYVYGTPKLSGDIVQISFVVFQRE